MRDIEWVEGNPFATLPDYAIAGMALQVKQGLDSALERAAKGEADKVSASYDVGLAVLENIEAEMVRRGMDPKAEELGFDHIGNYAKAKEQWKR